VDPVPDPLLFFVVPGGRLLAHSLSQIVAAGMTDQIDLIDK
jgi:hypothetical protein